MTPPHGSIKGPRQAPEYCLVQLHGIEGHIVLFADDRRLGRVAWLQYRSTDQPHALVVRRRFYERPRLGRLPAETVASLDSSARIVRLTLPPTRTTSFSASPLSSSRADAGPTPPRLRHRRGDHRRSASCEACGEPVRHMRLGRHHVIFDPTPVPVLAERLSAFVPVKQRAGPVVLSEQHGTASGRRAQSDHDGQHTGYQPDEAAGNGTSNHSDI